MCLSVRVGDEELVGTNTKCELKKHCLLYFHCETSALKKERKRSLDLWQRQNKRYARIGGTDFTLAKEAMLQTNLDKGTEKVDPPSARSCPVAEQTPSPSSSAKLLARAF